MKLSVVVITYNEAANIGRCLDSVQGLADEILVVDSFSTDQTLAIAQAKGARILQHPFAGHVEQKRYAIAQARYEQVLSLDADEALSPTLYASIAAVKSKWTHDGYYMNRCSCIGGQWIRYGGWYPDRKMRLFDRRRYTLGGINPHDKFLPADGARTTRLPGDLLHYTNDDIAARAETQNKFSTLAARAFFARGKRGSLLRLLFKPTFRFLSEYLFQRGFLDGFYGFIIARTSAYYVFLREAKLLEMSRRKGEEKT